MPATSLQEAFMTAVPTPVASSPTPEAAPALSQGARILNTFIAPSKTFTDLRRSAAWWAPFLLMVIVSTVFVYTAGQKIGLRRIMENQMQAQPKTQARLEQLPPDQRERQMEFAAKVTTVTDYAFPVLLLLMWLVIATALFATFRLAAGADVSFGISLAIVVYSALPMTLRSILGMVSVLAGLNPDSFSFQNPVASNPGYFLNPANGIFVYGLASQLDIFMIWTLVLTAIGFTCVSKVKRGTALAIVFGWWAILTLLVTGAGAAFS
jgi:hypothetical protein